MADTCHICKRVKWGAWVLLPGEKWRHDECAIGSDTWKEYYLGLSQAEQAPLRDFFNLNYPQVGGMHT